MRIKEHSWAVFDGWELPKPPKRELSWQIFNELEQIYVEIIEAKQKKLSLLVDKWDKYLLEFGGDPTHRNWEKFRPLRLNREENWSDWLAHLIEDSTTGVFAYNLFAIDNMDKTDYAKPCFCKREEFHDGYRADLVIKWRCGSYSHIEVKIGDTNFIKTYDTSRVLMDKHKASQQNWTNFILLLPDQIPVWKETLNNRDQHIDVVTWDKVAIALRKGIRSNEQISWKVWAYSIVGAIEQILLGFIGHLTDSNEKKKPMPSANIDLKLKILERGLENG